MSSARKRVVCMPIVGSVRSCGHLKSVAVASHEDSGTAESVLEEERERKQGDSQTCGHDRMTAARSAKKESHICGCAACPSLTQV